MRLSEKDTQNTERNPKTSPHTPRSYQKEYYSYQKPVPTPPRSHEHHTNTPTGFTRKTQYITLRQTRIPCQRHAEKRMGPEGFEPTTPRL